MKAVVTLDVRSRRMLELLARGAGSKVIAKELGYRDGTMRVYLHNLYRKLGLANKTEAVIWYLKQHGEVAPAHNSTKPAPRFEDPIGDMAVREGLYAMLGAMGQLIGPWNRIWEVGAKLAGDVGDIPPEGLRARSQWNALLKGDFVAGKTVFEANEYLSFSSDDRNGTSHLVYLAAVLAAGGYSYAARQLFSKVTDRRRSGSRLTDRDAALLHAALDTFEGGDGLSRLRKTAEGASSPAHRQLAMALVFHAAMARRDAQLARQAASWLWKEAENARRELQGMGDATFATALTPKAPAAKPLREKVVAS